MAENLGVAAHHTESSFVPDEQTGARPWQDRKAVPGACPCATISH